MSIDALRDALPDYAWDQKRNLDTLVGETLLSDQQKWGCFLACAYATDNPTLIRHMESAAAPALSEKAKQAAKMAATLMAMNTVYYGAINLLSNHDYRAANANLSMTALSPNRCRQDRFRTLGLRHLGDGQLRGLPQRPRS